eukprot:11203330-Lingulodinium_polyedra.AAC.1
MTTLIDCISTWRILRLLACVGSQTVYFLVDVVRSAYQPRSVCVQTPYSVEAKRAFLLFCA